MSGWAVRVPGRFWETLERLRPKYSREQMVEIIVTVKDCIEELRRSGQVRESGWDDHALAKPPFSDGMHFEFHVFDDDVLVVYFRRERRHVIRMVGIYDHDTIPG